MKDSLELVCVDCGRAVNPVEALEIRLPTHVMKVCPSCMGVCAPLMGADFSTRQEIDELRD